MPLQKDSQNRCFEESICRYLVVLDEMGSLTYSSFIMYPQGDLNPCLQAENLASWATRRWGP